MRMELKYFSRDPPNILCLYTRTTVIFLQKMTTRAAAENYDRRSNLPRGLQEEIEDTSFKSILTHSTLR